MDSSQLCDASPHSRPCNQGLEDSTSLSVKRYARQVNSLVITGAIVDRLTLMLWVSAIGVAQLCKQREPTRRPKYSMHRSSGRFCIITYIAILSQKLSDRSLNY